MDESVLAAEHTPQPGGKTLLEQARADAERLGNDPVDVAEILAIQSFMGFDE
ncbi:hypothetical protein [Saccharopolyspora elongata]|uniref:hypothetical protein n=1 Tax=Saccharopolyspora elongata TaxID=2530387 RepID=UPI001405255E|nr:hypothetical protein [Saccharopolyspora elongata]